MMTIPNAQVHPLKSKIQGVAPQSSILPSLALEAGEHVKSYRGNWTNIEAVRCALV